MSAESEKVVVKPAEHKKPKSVLKCIHATIIDWEQDWLRARKWISLCQAKKNWAKFQKPHHRNISPLCLWLWSGGLLKWGRMGKHEISQTDVCAGTEQRESCSVVAKCLTDCNSFLKSWNCTEKKKKKKSLVILYSNLKNDGWVCFVKVIESYMYS